MLLTFLPYGSFISAFEDSKLVIQRKVKAFLFPTVHYRKGLWCCRPGEQGFRAQEDSHFGRCRCRLVLRSGCPYAPRPYAAGPLCTAFSSFRQLQRRSTPRRHQRPLLAREETGKGNGRLILPVTQLPCNHRVL
jgi:hypothetical protein